ncbi:MAG: UDP-N-acetylmuramate--L-alanine ligase [Pirellulales bacterium]
MTLRISLNSPERKLPEGARAVGCQYERVHLVGALGSGMQALADVFRTAGCNVTGSDAQAIAEPNGLIHPGHAPHHVPEHAELVVASGAVPEDNCELVRARHLGIPTFSYAQMLGRLARGRTCLAVAGTHGKSTVAAMAAEILLAAGLDPTVVLGAMPRDTGRNCFARQYPQGGRLGRSELFLAEACEYAGNFLHLSPQVGLITGIEPDHFDCYRSRAELEAAFEKFASQVLPGGLLIVCGDCPVARRVAATSPVRVMSYGFGEPNDVRAVELRGTAGRYQFNMVGHRQECLCHRQGHGKVCLCHASIQLSVAGRHNVLNALAAAALATALEVPPPVIAASLRSFPGLRRRLEVVPLLGGVRLIDDYAHHPTAVAATLATAREISGGRRLWCIFQPHQVSRTAALLDEFAASLQNADKVCVTDVFRAREPVDSPTGELAARLVDKCRRLGSDALHLHKIEQVENWLAEAIWQGELTPGDVVVTMGAGDVGKIRNGLGQWIRKDRAAG